LGPRHAEDCAVEKNIFPAGQFRMKPGPDLQERANATVNVDAAGGRLSDSIQNFQERALTGTIAADNPERFTALDIERNILERPKNFRCRSCAAAQAIEEPLRQTDQLIVERAIAAQTLVR